MAEVVRARPAGDPEGQWSVGRALARLIGRRCASWCCAGVAGDDPEFLNSYVALFKDTTLVFFVGIFDFLQDIEVARRDPNGRRR